MVHGSPTNIPKEIDIIFVYHFVSHLCHNISFIIIRNVSYLCKISQSMIRDDIIKRYYSIDKIAIYFAVSVRTAYQWWY